MPESSPGADPQWHDAVVQDVRLPDRDRDAGRVSDLSELATTFGTDKGPKGHNYCPHYEREFAHLRNQPITLLEIGVWEGASLRMWEAWFPLAEIIGVDIAPKVPCNTDRISTIVCDIKTFEPIGSYDVIIDDGSHHSTDVQVAYQRLWPRIKPGGIYVIEDLDVQEVRSPALTIIEGILRELWHEHGDVAELHAYDQLVFIKKRA